MTPPTTPTAAELLQHAGALRALARRLVRDDATAEDVVQEAFAAALTRPPRHRSNLGGWLRVVARNVALRSHRGDSRRRRREHAVARGEARPSAEDAVALLEEQRAVVDAVLRLGEPYRSALVQHYFQGWSAARIARSEGVSRQAVSKRLAGGVARVRAALDRRHGGRRAHWLAALLPVAGLPHTAGTGAASSVATGAAVMGTKTLVGAAALSLGFFALGFASRPLLAPDEEPDPTVATSLHAHEAEPVLEGRSPPAPGEPPHSTAAAPPQPRADEWDRSDPKEWLQRINRHEVTQHAVPYFLALKQMPAQEARALLAWVFPRMNHEEKRVECLRAFGRTPRGELLVHVLGLSLADPTARVRKDAIYWAEGLGLEAFGEDPARLEAWIEENDGKPITQVIEENARAFGQRLKSLDPRGLHRVLESVDAGRFLNVPGERVDVAALLRREGVLEHLVQSLPRGNGDDEQELQNGILRWISTLKPDFAFVRQHFFDILREPAKHPPAVVTHAYALVGSRGTPEAIDALIASYETATDRMHWWAISTALAAAGATRAIPAMIGMIEADNGYNSIYGIGYFGLHSFTGVKYDESHDGRWWRDWWEKNSHRFAKEVPDPEIPRMSPVATGGSG